MLYPQAKSKVFLIGRFGNLDSLDIADPFSGTAEDFQVCFEAIRRACDDVLSRYVEHDKTATG